MDVSFEPLKSYSLIIDGNIFMFLLVVDSLDSIPPFSNDVDEEETLDIILISGGFRIYSMTRCH